MKNIVYSLVMLIVVGGVFFFRKNKTDIKDYHSIEGKTQGTTYKIIYNGKESATYQKEIDALLADFDASLSTWEKDSDISRFNKAKASEPIPFRHPYFYTVLQRSKEFFDLSNGRFDPTIAPLVNAWGFGFDKAKDMTPILLDSIKQLVSFDHLEYDQNQIQKNKEGVQLDFNAIAQGYSVDVVAAYLRKKGIVEFMVEIGGEYLCNGLNPDQKPWTIGIKDPQLAEKGETKAQAIIQCQDCGLATSGNYEKFYIKDGKKYAHTLDPLTGSPVTHNLLSTTIVAKDAMTADAFATLCLVIGVEQSKTLLKQYPDIAMFLIYEEHGALKTYANPPMAKIINENL